MMPRVIGTIVAVGVGLGLGVLVVLPRRPLTPKTLALLPTPEQVLQAYPGYRVLENDRPVNEGLTMLCRGPLPEEIAAAEKVSGPHASSMMDVRGNALAEHALKTGAATFPPGSILVKDKYSQGGVAGMIKREAGYNPTSGDWEFFIQEKRGPLAKGKLANCISCHATATGPDHLFVPWAAPKYSEALHKAHPDYEFPGAPTIGKAPAFSKKARAN